MEINKRKIRKDEGSASRAACCDIESPLIKGKSRVSAGDIQYRVIDSYVGGNNIDTNGAGSGVTVEDNFYEIFCSCLTVSLNGEIMARDLSG